MLGVDFTFLIDENDRKTLAKSASSTVHAATSSDINMLHFVTRLQPASGRFRPYLEAVIGFKHLETRTRVNEHFASFGDPNDCFFSDSTRPIDNDKNSSDFAMSYGVGAGLAVQVYTGDSFLVDIVVAARYLFGARAEYVIPSSVRIIDANTVAFETARSRTNLLTTQLGLSLRF